jgi:large subunit ribosomal protein L5
VTPRLQTFYKDKVVGELRTKFQYTNVNQVPRIQKIVLNVGLGEATQNGKIVDVAEVELAKIAGQKAVVTHARKAISNFKLKENQAIGVMVTLRRQRMWEFLDRLINVALPRVRDFQGVSTRAFDHQGNYNLGIREHNIFPEVESDKLERSRGMNITIVTSAKTDDEARELLRQFGMPFRK